MKDTGYIKGVSTINFEEVAKDLIYKSISSNNLTEFKKLRDEYTELKNRLGRVPYLYDFISNNSIDPLVIVREKDNYHCFLQKVKESVPDLSDYENKVLTFISNEIMNGKRHHEIILLKYLLEHGAVAEHEYIKLLEAAGCNVDAATLASVRRVLDLSFFIQANQIKFGGLPLCDFVTNGRIRFHETLQNSLKNNDHFRHLFADVIRTAVEIGKEYNTAAPLTLYKKYTRKEVCKLLNWESDESSTVYGYKTRYQTCPIYVTYHKSEEVESSIKYGDELLDPNTFRWFTRSNRTLESKEVTQIIHAESNNTDIHMFVKKDDDEGGDFYYLGKAVPDVNSVTQTKMTGKNNELLDVVYMNMQLEKPVDSKLYQYLISNVK